MDRERSFFDRDTTRRRRTSRAVRRVRRRLLQCETLESRHLLAGEIDVPAGITTKDPASAEGLYPAAVLLPVSNVATTDLRSDVDVNGVVDPQDILWAVYLYQHAGDASPAGPSAMLRGDVNQDRRIDPADILYVIHDFNHQFVGSEDLSAPADSPVSAWQLAWQSAADLSQYTPEQLNSAAGWAVQLRAPSTSGVLAGGSLTDVVGIPNAYVWTAPAAVAPADVAAILSAEADVVSFYPLVSRAYSTRTLPNDPMISQQWHLKNTGQSGGTTGEDANVEPVWTAGVTGKGVVIGIVDDGLQFTHPDLAANYVAAHSYDFNFNDSDPSPYSTDGHGTSAAGVAAARGNNGVGVAGAAYNASLAGLRLLAYDPTDSIEAAALGYHPQDIAIYSNSWGPYDDAARIEAPGPLTLAAFQNGVTNGRGGLGNIYVWAAGNGLQNNDNANYDGYASSRYTIGVSAVGSYGTQSYYSEPGASILVAGYSSDPGIVTTDLIGGDGYSTSDYTTSFGGTSSATPLVAGVIALMLEANPALTWRDVRQVLARSASHNSIFDTGWSLNGAGHDINHKFGFGAVDADAAVTLAKSWNTVTAESSYSSPTMTVNAAIPDNSTTGVTSTINVPANLRLEEVEVVFNATHTYRGDLEVVLTSPSGTQSILAQKHNDSGNDFSNWIFSSTRHLDELSAGNWTLTVRDLASFDTGVLQNWTLRLYGTPGDSDFGDLPATYEVAGAAKHGRMTGLQLGVAKDTEAAAAAPLDGTGDGADDDGVVLPAIVNSGGLYSYTVNVVGGKGLLDGWIDFNRDGDFLDTGEKIASSLSVINGLNALTFSAPGSSTAGSTYARFRLSTTGGLSPTGAAVDGEVEDYSLTIATPTTGTLDATSAAGVLTISDAHATGAANNLSFSRTGSTLTIIDTNEQFLSAPAGGTLSNGNHTLTFDLAATAIDRIIVNAAGESDLITLDLATGNPVPAGGVQINGGSGALNRLLLAGGNQGTASYRYANATDGQFTLSSFGGITYTGLTSLTNTGSVSDVVLELSPAPNDVTLQDDGTIGNGRSRLSGATVTSTDFGNPSGGLVVRRGGAGDIIRIASIPDVTSNLTVGASAEPFSQIDFNGKINLAGNKSLSASGSVVRFTSATSDVNVTGTNGGITLAGDDIAIHGSALVTSASTVVLKTLTAGRSINLGGAGGPTELGLTDAELDRVTAKQLQIGDAAGGPINVTAVISRPNAQAAGLLLAGPSTVFSAAGNDLNLASAALKFAAGTDLSFAINGATADSQYQQLNLVGTVRLTGADLLLSGSFQPLSSTTLTLIANDGADAVEGTFNGLPDGATVFVNGGAVRMRITYNGGDGNDVVLSPAGATVTGRIWSDVNANGVQDSGEPGVAQAVVELVGTKSFGTRSTDGNGNYRFEVPAGSNYTLYVRPPVGYSFTAKDAGGNDAADSDVVAATGILSSLTVADGELNQPIDAGLLGGPPGFGWAATDEYSTYVPIGDTFGYAVARDADGNVFYGGAKGYSNVGWIAKHNAVGARIWDTPLMSAGSGTSAVRELITLADGSILAAGEFSNSVDFDPSSNVVALSTTGSTPNVFVAKYSGDGRLIWAKQFAGNISFQTTQLAADADGNVFVGISFTGTIDADPSTAVDNRSSFGFSSTEYDILLVKLNAAGDREWASQYISSGVTSVGDMQLSPTGELVLAGNYSGTVDFDLGPGTSNNLHTSSGPFVLKLTADGGYLWSATGSGSASPRGMAFSTDGSIIVSGGNGSFVDFDPSSAVSPSVPAGGFIWKLTSAGAFSWVKSFGSGDFFTATVNVNGFAADAAGNLYIGGSTAASIVDFDPGPLLKTRSSFSQEGFVLQLNSAGEFLSVAILPDITTNNSGTSFVRGVVAGPGTGQVDIAGYYANSVDLDPSSGVFSRTSPVISHLFLSDLHFPYNNVPTISIGSLPLVTEDTPSSVISFTIGDLESSASSLTLSAVGTDPTFLPPQSFTFGGSGANRTMIITPAADRWGNAPFTLQITDPDGGVTTKALTLSVNPVNDAPSFTKGADLTFLANPPQQTIPGWATNISPGPYETQSVNFAVVGNSNPGLFSAAPALSPNGTLTFRVADNVVGTASISVLLQDDGSGTSGGINFSATQTFTITVNPPVSPPTISGIPNQTINEDGVLGPLSFTIGDAETPADQLTLSVITVGSHVPASGVVFGGSGADRTVTITPLPDLSGVASITVRVTDASGETSVSTFSLTVLPVNDAPSFVKGADQSRPYNSSAFTVTNWATAISKGPAAESTQTLTFNVIANSFPELFSVQPAVSPTGTLTYTKAPGMSGSATITLTLSDNGGTANGGVDVSPPQTFVITFDSDSQPPTVTGAPANQSILEDGTTGPLSFTVGDNVTVADALVITKTSSNTFLIPTANIVLGGSGADRTLTVTPAANENGGPVTITVNVTDASLNVTTFTFTITVLSVNDVPSFTKGLDQIVNEDTTARTIFGWASGISMGGGESGQLGTFIVTNNTNPSLFSVAPAVIGSSGTLTYTPAPNAFGTAAITIILTDNGGTANGGVDTSAPQTFNITINSINDAPVFVKGGDQTVNEDAGPQTVTGWATNISPGGGETGQTLTFTLTNTNSTLFSVQPTLDVATGTLQYTPAPDAFGTATVTVTLADNGGTANGGVSQTSQAFTITVNSVNDRPTFVGGANQTVNEDSGSISVSAWASSINQGAANESGQTLIFNISSFTNATIFSTGPSISSSGTLSYTLAANTFGTSTVTVVLTDTGGTANGGFDTTAPYVFTITVNPVNDRPTFTNGTNVTVLEDSGAQTIPGWATLMSAGPANEAGQTLNFVLNTSSGAMFSVFPTVNAVTGALSFTPAPNAAGSAFFTISLVDDGGTLNGGQNTSSLQSFSINITGVNDPPNLTPGGDVVRNEDASQFFLWAAVYSDGDPESFQSTTFTVLSVSNPGLFSVTPTLSTGYLSYTPAANANGTAVVTYQLSDDGGTANGGVNVAGPFTFSITISPVNDRPTFTAATGPTVLEDIGPQSIANWATAISPGPANESGQLTTFSVAYTNPTLFAVPPTISPSGTLDYTLAPNMNGSSNLIITLIDDGGTANGGQNTSTAAVRTITVNSVNDAPSFLVGPDIVVNEDSGPFSQTAWASAIAAGPPNESTQTVNFLVTGISDTSLFAFQPTISSAGNLSFTPLANAFGSAIITVELGDNGGTSNGGVNRSAPQTFLITINPINNVPTFVKGANQTVTEDAGPQTKVGWATSISAGPPNESTQNVSFQITNNTAPSLFAVPPAVAANGTLTYTLAPDAFGAASITLTISDDGGTANGGVNVSSPQTFVINAVSVNDVPTFAKGANQTVAFNAPPQSIAGWATGLSAGPPNESGQTLSFEITANSNVGLFAVAPAIAADGTLSYQPAAGISGSATISVRVVDDGGTANGGVDASSEQTFEINVLDNRTPTISAVADQSTHRNVPLTGIAFTVGDAETAAGSLIVSAVSDNAVLFPPGGISIGGTGPNRSLSLIPALNQTGSATIIITVDDGFGGIASESFSVQVSLSTQHVTSFVPTATGARFTLSEPAVIEDILNLYDYRNTALQNVLGDADVQLTGAVGGGIRGSLIVEPGDTSFKFVSFAGVLPPDDYTLTLRSAANGFQTAAGQWLDGDEDDSAGGSFVRNFTVAAPTTEPVILAVPNFARGPKQAVNVPESAALGLPVTVSNGGGLVSAVFDLRFDPGLLNITDVNLPAAVSGAKLFTLLEPGVARVSLSFAAPLSGGPATIAYFTANVPATAANRYGERGVLDLENISLLADGGASVPSLDGDAAFANAYFADVSRDGEYNSFDVQQVQRVAVGLDTGYRRHPLLDPRILTDFDRDSAVNSFDVQRTSRLAVGLPIPELPALPTIPVVITSTNRFASVGSTAEEAKGSTAPPAADWYFAPPVAAHQVWELTEIAGEGDSSFAEDELDALAGLLAEDVSAARGDE